MKLNYQLLTPDSPELNTTPVILLHGLFGSLDNLRRVGRSLSGSYPTYSLDLRNHGQSPHAAAMNYPAMAADVFEFMQDQQITCANVLGHSMGGKVAMQMALQKPESR